MNPEVIKFNIGNTACHLSITEHSEPPKSSFVHIHPYYELFYVFQGNLKITLDEEEYAISAGQAALIAPDYYHQTCFMPNTKIYSIPLSFNRDTHRNTSKNFYPIFAKAFSDFSIKIIPNAKKIASTVSAIHSLFANSPFGLKERLHAECVRLFFATFDCIADSLKDLTEDMTITDDEELKYKLDRLLAENFTKDIDLDFLASSLYLSRKRVSLLLKELYGKPFRYIKTEMRIQFAKQLLKENELSIAAIGEKIGYNSTRGFLSAFFDYTNMTPKQYREFYLKMKRINIEEKV